MDFHRSSRDGVLLSNTSWSTTSTTCPHQMKQYRSMRKICPKCLICGTRKLWPFFLLKCRKCDLICHKKCLSKSNSLTSTRSLQTFFCNDEVTIPDVTIALGQTIMQDDTEKNVTAMVLEQMQQLILSKELIFYFDEKKLCYFILRSIASDGTASLNYSDSSLVVSAKYPGVMERWCIWWYEEVMHRSRRTWSLDSSERTTIMKVAIKFSNHRPEMTATTCSVVGPRRVDKFIATSLVVSLPLFGWPSNEPFTLAASHPLQHRSIASLALGGLHRSVANLTFRSHDVNNLVLHLRSIFNRSMKNTATNQNNRRNDYKIIHSKVLCTRSPLMYSSYIT